MKKHHLISKSKFFACTKAIGNILCCMQNTVANNPACFMSFIFDPVSEAQFYPLKKPKLEISIYQGHN